MADRVMDKILAKSSGETLAEHTIECLKAAQSLIESLHFPKKKEYILAKRFSCCGIT